MASPAKRPATQRTERVRMAFVPAVLAAIALLAGLALVGGEWFIVVRFAVAILAAIMAAFAVRGKQYWWLIGLVPVVIVWNPVWPLEFDELVWRLGAIAGAAVLIAAGIRIAVPVEAEQNQQKQQKSRR